MPEIIDANSHVMTEAVLDELEAVHPSDQASTLRSAPRLFATDERVDFLDRHGIDQQVINLARPTIWRGLEPEEALSVTRTANDEVRRMADEHPDRFVPTGTLPFLDGEYLDEARRCVEELDLPGIQIFSNVDGRGLDDEAFDEFWATVDALDVPVWIHPQLHEWHDFETGETWIYKMLGWPFDTSVAIARLVFGGVLDRHDGVEVITHHLGGTVPYLVGRFRSWYQTRQEEPDLYAEQDVAELSEPLDHYLERVHADTAVSSQGESYPLECGYAFFGPDNLVYSSDYPMGPDEGEYWPTTILEAIDGLPASRAEKEAIYAGNAKRLLGL